MVVARALAPFLVMALVTAPAQAMATVTVTVPVSASASVQAMATVGATVVVLVTVMVPVSITVTVPVTALGGGDMQQYSLYDSFTIEEVRDAGRKFKATCIADYGYEQHLTVGKEYDIEVTPPLSLSPLCKFIGDRGVTCEAHLHRFIKVKEK
jgi:hypothetical protein